jgi:hypothetical protein
MGSRFNNDSGQRELSIDGRRGGCWRRLACTGATHAGQHQTQEDSLAERVFSIE